MSVICTRCCKDITDSIICFTPCKEIFCFVCITNIVEKDTIFPFYTECDDVDSLLFSDTTDISDLTVEQQILPKDTSVTFSPDFDDGFLITIKKEQ